MASRYGTRQRKRGSRYATATVRRGTPKRDNGFSLGGLISNALDETRSMIYGAPRGLWEAGKAEADLLGAVYSGGANPINKDTKRLGSGLAQSYAQTYGRGWRGLYENPVSVVLDALTVASGGAALGAKAGLAPARATRLVTASGKTVSVPRSRRALRSVTQAGTDAALKQLPQTAPKLGEFARAGRVQARRVGQQTRYEQTLVANLDRKVRKLHKADERMATSLRAIFQGDRDAYEWAVNTWRQTDSPLADIADRPRVRALYEQPTERMQTVLSEMRVVGEEQKRLLGIADETAEARKFLGVRLAGGARFTDDVLEGGPSLDDLRARVAAGELDEPVYFPHATADERRLRNIVGRGGGRGPQPRNPNTRQNVGALIGRGDLSLEPTLLTQSFLRAVKTDHYTRVHQTLLSNGRAFDISTPEGLAHAKAELRANPGWDLVRQTRSQKIPASLRQAEAQGDWLDEIAGDLKGFEFERGQQVTERLGELTTRNLDEAAKVNKTVIMVPRAYVKQVAGEFTRAGSFAYLLNKYPVRVWRALVLNLRPAWLVNNMIGNTLMYAIHQGDATGARALLQSFKRTWPEHAGEFERIFRRTGQANATFIGTQRPIGVSGRLGRTVVGRFGGKIVGGLADIDRWYETVLRRASVRAELRRHPQLRARALGMRKETRDYWAAVEKQITPEQLDELGVRVNTGLGDFTSLTGFEKNVLRTVFPFYAWFRAIAGVSLKLPLEHPLKANIMSRLGEIGAEMNLEEMGVTADEVPAFLRGMIPLGDVSGGRVPVAATGPPNPFGTSVDLAEFADALLRGKPGQAGREFVGMNPYIQGLLQQITGTNMTTGAPVPDYGFGPLNPLMGIGEGLPQVRLGKAFSGNAYQGTPSRPTLYDQDTLDLLLRYLGLPYARVSTRRAKQIEKRSRG